MDSIFDLSVTDVDGAVREAQDGVAGDTRAAFFRKAAVGGGAVLTSGAFMGMLPELAAAAKPSKKQDLAILNFALTLEYLESAFYKEAVEVGTSFDDNVKQFAALVSDHEATHVTALRATIKGLGGKPVSKPKFDFKGTPDKQDSFLRTSFVLENTGVHAYLGQAGNLKSKKLLGVAATIVTIEARHAAAVATLLNQQPFKVGMESITPNGSFDTAFTKGRVLAAVKGTGFIVG